MHCFKHPYILPRLKRYLYNKRRAIHNHVIDYRNGSEGDTFQKLKLKICQNTQFVRSQMVPEFGMHGITPDMQIWHQSPDELPNDFFAKNPEPYWAIFWPGGQILSRYILDNPSWVKERRVLDLGAGCGTLTLASIMAGCKSVMANDIDAVSLSAVLLNMETNNLNCDKLKIVKHNFLEGDLKENAIKLASETDVLLVGDMYFDEILGDRLSQLLLHYTSNSSNGNERKMVLIGDPDRWYLKGKREKHVKNSSDYLTCLAKYELSNEIKAQNYGLTQGFVYTMLF